MFCKESLRKIKFRDFPECVGPQILPIERVDYLERREHNSVVGKKKESLLAKLQWSGVVNFFCMQMGFVMSMRVIFGDD